MADLTQTPANVLASVGIQQNPGVAGGTLTAGDVIYKDGSNLYQRCDANGSDPSPTGVGVVTCSASANQPIWWVATDPNFNPGATTVVGTVYVASANPGKICPVADLATGHKVTNVGVGKTGNLLDLDVHATGIAVP